MHLYDIVVFKGKNKKKLREIMFSEIRNAKLERRVKRMLDELSPEEKDKQQTDASNQVN